ncbi:GntR family transcriptional regulator [Planotetraspora sp. A-T 1434]|uniref:GntR family transcriptional regulator n=1 Tax=Planotetraspora sp. A-T 1434 TaxID=2979219 RepID=UPI0021BF4005|nr:GntR family transcriptional regulator [Planotetraspora sp. A-T 1434]MCT9931873.1 GntR family transcriptional regulator [Planotetraspora sp. A-T 1434]
MAGHEILVGQIDPASDRAVFRQIADHLREAIEGGRLSPGDKLPSEAALMQHYNVARMTVRHAMQELQGEGLAVAEHGRGVFVRSRPPVKRLASDRFARRHRKEGKAAFIAESEVVGAKASVDMIDVREGSPLPEIAERLKVRADEAVVIRSRRYSLDGRPVELATSYIPADLALGTRIMDANPGPGGIYARLEEQGRTLDRFTEDVFTRMPTREEARLLLLAPGVPVFRLIRTAYDLDGRSVEVCDTIMSGDAYQLSYELPAH